VLAKWMQQLNRMEGYQILESWRERGRVGVDLPGEIAAGMLSVAGLLTAKWIAEWEYER